MLAKENKKSMMKFSKEKRKSEAIDRNKVRAVYRKDFGGELKRVRSDACASVLQYFDEEEVYQEQTEHSRAFLHRSMREQSTAVDPDISRAHLEALLRSAFTCDEAFLSGLSNGAVDKSNLLEDGCSGSNSDDSNGVDYRHKERLQGNPNSAVEVYKGRDSQRCGGGEKEGHREGQKSIEREKEGEGGNGVDPIRWDDVFQVVNCLNVFSTHLELQMPLMLTDVVEKMVKITLAGESFKSDALDSHRISLLGPKSISACTANGSRSENVDGSENSGGSGSGSDGAKYASGGIDGVSVGDGSGNGNRVCVMSEVRHSDSAVQNSLDAMDIVTDEATPTHSTEIEENKAEVEKEVETNTCSVEVADNGASTGQNNADYLSHGNQHVHDIKTEINGKGECNSNMSVIANVVKQEHENNNEGENENGIESAIKLEEEEEEHAVKKEGLELMDVEVEVEVEEKQGEQSTDAPKVRPHFEIDLHQYVTTWWFWNFRSKNRL